MGEWTHCALTHLYWQSHTALRRATGISEALFQGLWLGILPRGALHTLDTDAYTRWQHFTSDAHNTQGLFAWEQQALEKHFKSCKHLAVLAAGGGREILALERHGYRVRGFECNPHLMRTANRLLSQHGCESRVEELPRDTVPPGTYDGCILGWGMYSLIPERTQRVGFLRKLHRCLPEGGPLLLSFYERRELSAKAALTCKVGSALRTMLRQPPLELGDSLAPTYGHKFTQTEVAQELETAGLTLKDYASIPYPHAIGSIGPRSR